LDKQASLDAQKIAIQYRNLQKNVYNDQNFENGMQKISNATKKCLEPTLNRYIKNYMQKIHTAKSFNERYNLTACSESEFRRTL